MCSLLPSTALHNQPSPTHSPPPSLHRRANPLQWHHESRIAVIAKRELHREVVSHVEAVKAKQRAREGGDDADMPEAERQQKKELAAIRKAEDDLAEKRALLDGRRKLSAAVSRARLDLQDAQRKLEAAEVELRSTERRVMVVAAALENERFEKKQVRRRVVVLAAVSNLTVLARDPAANCAS